MSTTVKDYTPECGNPYKILSIPITATTAQIKKAFRTLSLQVHPDKQQQQQSQTKTSKDDLVRKFIQVQEAKSFLLDDEHAALRKRYDAQLAGETRRRDQETTRDAMMDRKRRQMRDALNVKLRREEEGERNRRRRNNNTAGNGATNSTGTGGGGTEDSTGVDGLKKAGKRMRETYGERRADEDARYDRSESRKRKDEVNRRQIHLRWSRQKVSHSKNDIFKLFSDRFGAVEEVELIGSKGNAALITFQSASSCKPCVEAYLQSNEMRATFVGKRKDEENMTSSEPAISLDDGWKDRESVEERKLRQAAERESLLRQMEMEETSGQPFQATGQNQPRERVSHPAKKMAKTSSFPPKFPSQALKLTSLERLEEMEVLILKDLLSPIILKKIQIMGS